MWQCAAVCILTLQEAILCSLLPEEYWMRLLRLPSNTIGKLSNCQGDDGIEAILSWVLQALIKPGHAVDQCENYVEKHEPFLLSVISAHHLKFFRGHITCLLEHYMTDFRYSASTVTMEELSNVSNWVQFSNSAKRLDILIQNLRALLQQNKIIHDATILKVSKHLC